MDSIVEKKKAMTFTGYVTQIDSSLGKGYQQIPLLWKKIMKDNLFEGLMKSMDELGPVGISYDYDMNTGNFKYMIGVRNDIDSLDNTEKLYLNEQEYAVFKAIGPMPSAIQGTIEKFHNEWLPNSEYNHSGKAEIEIYSNGDPSSEDYVSYLWVTVNK